MQSRAKAYSREARSTHQTQPGRGPRSWKACPSLTWVCLPHKDLGPGSILPSRTAWEPAHTHTESLVPFYTKGTRMAGGGGVGLGIFLSSKYPQRILMLSN